MKTVVMIPTYNERENIAALVNGLLKVPAVSDILVVDDDSPDGTWRVVEEIASKEPRVRIIRRLEKRGRGWAGADGFRAALDMGAERVVEMDGDGSHSPEFVGHLASALDDADVAIGSRYVSGGRDIERTILRKAVSAFARRYLAAVLGLSVSDPTSGFRAFRRDALEKIVGYLKADDPFIVTEVLYYAKKYSMRIKDVPISFLDRLGGKSKLKPSTLAKYLIKVWKLKLAGI
ncbi:MAG: polyprenol monophosphomannose synthase [Endomicrobiia bacterium]|nr:polyprenol monophosphomannose synthase [Endomicrobiia bacterium]